MLQDYFDCRILREIIKIICGTNRTQKPGNTAEYETKLCENSVSLVQKKPLSFSQKSIFSMNEKKIQLKYENEKRERYKTNGQKLL